MSDPTLRDAATDQLTALCDSLHEQGFRREEDWFERNAGTEYIEQIHIDTLDALRAALAAAPQVFRPSDPDPHKTLRDAMATLDAAMHQRNMTFQSATGIREWDAKIRVAEQVLIREVRAELAAAPQAEPAPVGASEPVAQFRVINGATGRVATADELMTRNPAPNAAQPLAPTSETVALASPQPAVGVPRARPTHTAT